MQYNLKENILLQVTFQIGREVNQNLRPLPPHPSHRINDDLPSACRHSRTTGWAWCLRQYYFTRPKSLTWTALASICSSDRCPLSPSSFRRTRLRSAWASWLYSCDWSRVPLPSLLSAATQSPVPSLQSWSSSTARFAARSESWSFFHVCGSCQGCH